MHWQGQRRGSYEAAVVRGVAAAGARARAESHAAAANPGALDEIGVSSAASLASVIEATNILDEAQTVRFMPIDLPANYVDSGRRILLGLRARF